MGRLRIAVITDNGQIPAFGLAALDAVEECDEVTVFSCTDAPAEKRARRHAAYHALTARASRHPWATPVPINRVQQRVEERVHFSSAHEGARQALPPEIVRRIRDGDFSVVLKLGMEGLQVPSPDVLPVPILSFRLEGPEGMAGDAAAFWAIANGEPALGQTVEVVHGRLGARTVVARAETKVFPHSYRATLAEAYRHFPLLMGRAIAAVLADAGQPGSHHDAGGRLPSTADVAWFVLMRAWSRLRRLGYGAVVEKRWQVSTAAAPADTARSLDRGELLSEPHLWRTIQPQRGYVFYADPFFSEDPPGVLVEALKSSTGRGEILLVQGEDHHRVSPPGGHFSYPATLRLDGQQIVVPETAAWASPTCYVLHEGQLRVMHALDLDPPGRILDPTLLEHDGRLYLFGNLQSIGSNALCVWLADSLSSPFRPHPMNPVLISPRGARMAGGFVRSSGRLIRFGQDFCGGYGDGIYAFEVAELSPTTFRERPIGDIRFTDRKGPHTLNFGNGSVVFDWYRDRFAPFAGLRRMLNRIGET